MSNLSLFKDPKCQAFFEYFGLAVFSYTFLKLSLRILNNFTTFFLGSGSIDFKKYGSWAVVTGCTDGIGKSYAELLAKRGLNIVLISRTLSKLEVQAKELEEKYSIHTKVISADFTDQESIYPKIKSVIADLEVAVLINNVGMSYKYPDYFEAIATDEKLSTDLINCNITSVTRMTAIVLSGMVKRKKGVIVNVGSASGRIPTPLITVYSATKAYVDFFSQALNLEYKNKGIIVQSLNPYFVSTKLSGARKSLLAPSPNDYVSNALKTIGSQPVSNGYLYHNIQGFLSESLPRSILDHVMMKMLSAIRKKGIAKAKRAAEANQ